MVELIPSFVSELEKLARVTAAEKVTAHHLAEKKDWGSFEKNLASPAFRRAVLAAQESDPKLKKYVKTFGAYKGSKDVVAEITSASSGKSYVVKDLHNGRLGCNCKDWQFKHSIAGSDCKHIKSVKQSKLVKESTPLGVGFTMTRRSVKAHEKGKKMKSMARELSGPRDPGHYLPWDERLMRGSL